MTFYRMVKPMDIIIIVVLFSLSFVPIVIFSYQHAGSDGDLHAVISSRGEVLSEIKLTDYDGEETFLIHDHHDHKHENVVEIQDGQIRIKAANCPDQICVRRGFISKPGQTIVCIPHQLVIEIKSERGVDDEVIISS